jgi:hypothetical protein
MNSASEDVDESPPMVGFFVKGKEYRSNLKLCRLRPKPLHLKDKTT